MRKVSVVGLVVVLVVAAAVISFVYLSRIPSDPLISKLDQLLSAMFGSVSTHISYKVSSRNETKAVFDLYLDHQPDPFYAISYVKWGSDWMVESHGVLPNASSPAKGLIIKGYGFFDGGFQVVVINPTRLVALIHIVEVKLENPTETHHGLGGFEAHGYAALVAPREIRALGLSWGISWEGRGALPEDALAGKSFTVTITLKDGRGEVVAEESSAHYFQPGEGIGSPTMSVIQIFSAPAGGTNISIQLIFAGTYPTINAVYVEQMNGTMYGGALEPRIEFSPPTDGSIVSVDIRKLDGGAGRVLMAGDVVKVVCVDAGGSSVTAGVAVTAAGNVVVTSIGAAKVEAYQDSSCTIPLTYINWGSLSAGASKQVDFYLKNTGTVSIPDIAVTVLSDVCNCAGSYESELAIGAVGKYWAMLCVSPTAVAGNYTVEVQINCTA